MESPPQYKKPSESTEGAGSIKSPPPYNPSKTSPEADERKSAFVYKKKSSGSGRQWISVLTIIIGGILIISGLTIYIFISVFQEETVEKKGVEFPFHKETLISFTSVHNINSQIRGAVHREESTDSAFEITFQEHGRPLFINDILRSTGSELPERVGGSVDGFSIGVHDGNVFILMSFKRDAYPLLSEHSDDIFQSLEYFIGRASTRELERARRANTLLVSRNGGVVYGFLNDHTIAVLDTEEFFLKILKLYRDSFN